MISFVLCFGFSFSVYADSVSIKSYWGIVSGCPLLLPSSVQNIYESSGGVYSNIIDYNTGQSIYKPSVYHSWSQSDFDSVINFTYFTEVSYNSVTYDLSNAYFVLGQNYNNNGYYYSYFFNTNNDEMAVLGSYVVCESPITRIIIWVGWGDSTYTISSVQTVNEANYYGFYAFHVNASSSYYYMPSFTNLSLYAPSSDGKSGFNSYESFSFDNVNDYYDFNYQITGNYFVDPNAPDPVLPSQDKYNLKFKATSFYAADNYEKFYENFRFNWNTYTLDHPESYYFCSNYYVVYQDDTMNQPVTFYYGSNDYPGQIFSDNLVSMAYRGKNNGVIPTTWSWGLYLSGFHDQNGKTLDRYISETINRVTGTHVDFAEPSTIFTAINGDLTDVLNWITATPIYSVIPLYESYIVKFVVTGEHWLSTGSPDWDGDNITEVESNHYISSYNFLSGNTDIISTNNVYEPYESEDTSFVPSSFVSGGSGGGVSNIYNAPNASATATGGNVTVNMGSNDPYHIEQVDYDNIGEVFDTVKRDMSRESGNGFFQVIAHVFAFIPSQIWQVLLTGITVITAVSVIRFVRNK